ncbi:M1 family metallopeptidase [Aquiflexum lacus]|uniref:M1 family metallopeptidase n=1 Tax=Aquiflexum lacus TaxID=2483805 RepID=UPI001895381C|nr:M1 family metallopeptidase [Aquiflexum lacus]
MRFYKPNAVFFLLLILIWSCQGTKKLAETDLINDSDLMEEVEATAKAGLIQSLEQQITEYKASRTRDFDLLHTELDLSFDYENQWVKGEAILTLKPYFFTQKELVLDAKDFDIHGFTLLGTEDESKLNFKYNSKKVTAFLPNAITANDTIRVRIKYTAKPNEGTAPGSAAITDTKGLYFINPKGDEANKPTLIWTQGETEHNSKWFPTIDSPNERMTQEIRLTVDDKYRTISNGRLQSSNPNPDGTRTDHWIMDLPHAPYLAAVIVGDYVEIEDSWEGMQVNYYVEKEFEEGAKTVFKNTPEMIGFFSDLLGVRYPWQKYDQVVVRDFVSGAMENTTITVFMEELNLDERGAIDSEWDGIIAHELFHQWFGNLVTTESWSNLTLNEAFANYSEYLWYEHKEGKDDADMHHISEMEQYFDEAKTKQEDLIRFYYDNNEDMFDSHSYAKGGRILHMLRRYLGDEAFFASFNHYLNNHAFSSVEVHDLRLAFEQVTGQDLNWFFNQWFLDSGHPILEYEVDYSQPDNLLLTVAQRQDFEITPLYKIPFKVSWYDGGQRFEKELVLDKAWQQFAIENVTLVKSLYFDEASEILAEKKSYRGKEFFLDQYRNSTLGVARYEAIDSLGTMFADAEDVIDLIGIGLKDDFWAIRELSLMKIAENPEWMELITNLEDMLFEIAENDPKNTVRLGAIELLSAIDPDKYSPAFLRWMNHPSYYVAGAALGAYLENAGNLNREAIASRFEDEKNIRLLVALADYYISESVGEKSNWFNDKLEILSGQSLYYFLGYYGDYFAKNTNEDTGSAIKNLSNLASKHHASYVRIAAFMGLFGFIDEPGVLEMAKKSYEEESDDFAKRYKEFFLSTYIEEN